MQMLSYHFKTFFVCFFEMAVAHLFLFLATRTEETLERPGRDARLYAWTPGCSDAHPLLFSIFGSQNQNQHLLFLSLPIEFALKVFLLFLLFYYFLFCYFLNCHIINNNINFQVGVCAILHRH